MPKTKPKEHQTVDVGDLLRLKRHERPDEAYWARFDRELHEKTLRTLVKQRPQARSIWALLGRWQAVLPLAGAAAFALTLAMSNGLLKFPKGQSPVEVASITVTSQTTVAVDSKQPGEPVGSHSFVVSALPAQESFSRGNYTQVPASRAMTPAHRPEVKFIGGTIATSIPQSGYSAGIY